jgi:hypothetical protein
MLAAAAAGQVLLVAVESPAHLGETAVRVVCHL